MNAKIQTFVITGGLTSMLLGAGCYALAPTAPTEYERTAARQMYDDNGLLRSPEDFDAGDAGNDVRALYGEMRGRGADGHTEGANSDVFIRPWFRDAAAFCNDVQRQSSHASTQYAILGWTFGAIGLMATGASTALVTTSGPDGFSDQSWRATSGAAIGLSAAFTAFGIYWLSRSVNADHAATAAIHGLEPGNGTPEDAWKTCLSLRADWTKENAVATEHARDRIEQAANRVEHGLDAGLDTGLDAGLDASLASDAGGASSGSRH